MSELQVVVKDESMRPMVHQETEETLAKLNEASAPVPIEDLYDKLIATIRKYHPSDDISLIEKAYHVAKEAHGDQLRKSGEPYISHPIQVAIILAELEMDKETVAAAILHDVVEDTNMSLDDLKEEFGEEVALLVDGVTKLTQIKYTTDKI